MGIGRALVINGSIPKFTAAINRMLGDEKDLLQAFWQGLRAFTNERGTPTIVTWNGLDFTFPSLIERSLRWALSLFASCLGLASNSGSISIFSPNSPPTIRTGI
jgi:predicted PolB exonuclease-like 3'-5' exonuclease